MSHGVVSPGHWTRSMRSLAMAAVALAASTPTCSGKDEDSGASGPRPRACGGDCAGGQLCPEGTACLLSADGNRLCLPDECNACVAQEKACHVDGYCTFLGCGIAGCGEACGSAVDCKGENLCLEVGWQKLCVPGECRQCIQAGTTCVYDEDNYCQFVECELHGCSVLCTEDSQCAPPNRCILLSNGNRRCLPDACQPCTEQDLGCAYNADTCQFRECALFCGDRCDDDAQCQDGIICTDDLHGARLCLPPECDACREQGLECRYSSLQCTFSDCRRREGGEPCDSSAQCKTQCTCLQRPSGESICTAAACRECWDGGGVCTFGTALCDFRWCD